MLKPLKPFKFGQIILKASLFALGRLVLPLIEISKVELHAFNFQEYEAKRKVASFGFDYNFEMNSLSKKKKSNNI